VTYYITSKGAVSEFTFLKERKENFSADVPEKGLLGKRLQCRLNGNSVAHSETVGSTFKPKGQRGNALLCAGKSNRTYVAKFTLLKPLDAHYSRSKVFTRLSLAERVLKPLDVQLSLANYLRLNIRKSRPNVITIFVLCRRAITFEMVFAAMVAPEITAETAATVQA